MAKTPTNSKNPFAFKPVILDHDTHQKRRVVKHLPAVHQTETLQKFFGATADHLFDPGTAKPINGYIGQRPLWHNPDQDYYLDEPSAERDFYQLEPSMVSKDAEGNITNLLFYPDLMNHLRFQGGITNNHNRMFEQDIYTWCPPVDLDKMVNFRQYVWLPVHELEAMHPSSMARSVYGPTVVYKADGDQFVFFLPGQTDDEDVVSPADFYDLAVTKKSLLRVHVDGIAVAFNYKGATETETGDDFITFDAPPPKDARVQIWVYSDVENNVLGEKSVSPLALAGNKLTSGMRIRLMMDKNTDYKPADIYIVEGVGESIKLVKEPTALQVSNELADIEAAKPDYLVMARGAENGNPWSRRNRWFHVSSLISTWDSDEVAKRRATRPIVEFHADLELFNYGQVRRPHIDVIVDAKKLGIPNLVEYVNAHPTTMSLDGVEIAVTGGNHVMINGIDHGQGARILLVNSDETDFNNKIFALVNEDNVLTLVVENDSLDPSGDPSFGELFDVRFGSDQGNEFNFNGSEWVRSQKKTQVNQYPLFMLYDMDGIELNDPSFYPESTFAGSRLFAYQESLDEFIPKDLVLNLRLVRDNKGDALFENYLETIRYFSEQSGEVEEIPGFYFHRTVNLANGVDELSNDWFKAPQPSKQFLVDRFLPKAGERLFTMSQLPAEGVNNLQVWRGRVDGSGNFTRSLLIEDTDFIRNGKKILVTDIQTNDIIEIKTFNPANPDKDATGFYELPLCLQANPDSETVVAIAKGDFYAHFSEIIRSQEGFVGAEYAINNYRDTAKDHRLGTHIVQHGAPLLKTMLLASDSRIDLMRAARFAESEYNRFKDKFHQKVLAFSQSQKYANVSDPGKWVTDALTEINLGKTKSFPFYNSKVAGTSTTPTFIPATPSFVGVYPAYEPQLVTTTVESTDGPVEVSFVRGHDGSWTRGHNSQCAAILFELEKRILASMPTSISGRERPAYDWQQEYGDGLRSSRYSYAEYLQLLQPNFERWTTQYNQNYRINETFVENDVWTYNWSSTASFDGSKLPGHWRGIYEKFYGTARPDKAPWEMLGFANPPAWWGSRYGPGPYTSDNTVLWDDIEKGFIFAGDRVGINKDWARPGIKDIIPVDEFGVLKDPYEAGIATTLPLVQEARNEWVWGDNGPVEQEWRRSPSFAFACAMAGYLMKPAMFVEFGWDTENLVKLFAGEAREQWMNTLYNARPRSADLKMHGEDVDTLEPVSRIGIQQWIADLLISRNTNVNEALGDTVRGLGSQLAYKAAGFVDEDTLVIASDAFGRLPNEDVSISLYRSPSIQEESYSGVAIEWTGEHFRVFGYDPINPNFKILPGDTSGSQVKIGGTGRSDISPEWLGGVYYSVNITVSYGKKYYRCVKTHTSGSVFETDFWQEVARPQYADGSSLLWLLDVAQPAEVQSVAYGETFKGPQDIANFINGYDRYLESRGWLFEEVNTDNSVNNWQEALKAFIVWSRNEELNPGDVISLSPGSTSIKFVAQHGTIQPVEQIVNGAYSIVDQLGKPIDQANTIVVRHDSEMTVTSNSDSAAIYGLRLFVSELEHVVVFNNKTIFNDVIYSPLLNIRQPRLRAQGFRTIAWTGRVDAPGFVISGNTITPNFERSADDFRRFFGIEAMENKVLQDHARANFGYEEREYLNNLLLGPTNQFEFYQGMIQQKGSPTSMRRLLRSSFVQHNKGLQLFEEWAFRVGDYGGAETQPSMELNVVQKDFKHNPQMFDFVSAIESEVNELPVEVPGVTRIVDTRESDGDIASLDPRWAWRPETLTVSWPMRNNESDTSRDLPTAGFVNMDEVRWFAPRKTDWTRLVANQIAAGGPLVEEGDRVWYYGIDSVDNAWKTAKYLDTGFQITSFKPTIDGNGTVVAVTGDTDPFEEGVGPITTVTGNTDPSKFYVALKPTNRTDFTGANLLANDDFVVDFWNLAPTATTGIRSVGGGFAEYGFNQTNLTWVIPTDGVHAPTETNTQPANPVVIPGVTYYFSTWAQKTTTAVATDVAIGLAWFNSAGTEISRDDLVWSTDSMGTGAPKSYTVSAVAPAGAATVRCFLYVAPVASPSGSVRFERPILDTKPLEIQTEQLVLQGVDGVITDLNGKLVAPKFFGTGSAVLSAANTGASVIGLYPEAGTYVRKITVKVTEAFEVDSILKVGTELYDDEFIQAPNNDPVYPDLDGDDSVVIAPRPEYYYGDDATYVPVDVVRTGEPDPCALPTVVNWSYQRPSDVGFVAGGTLTFDYSGDLTDESHYLQTINVPISTAEDAHDISVKLEVVGSLDPAVIETISVSKASTANINFVDLTQVGTYEFTYQSGVSGIYPYEATEERGQEVRASLATTEGYGSVEVSVEYFYTKGFEIVEEIDNDLIPVASSGTEEAGFVFSWLPTSFEHGYVGNIPQGVLTSTVDGFSSSMWNDGDLIEVKVLTAADGGNDGWAVLRYEEATALWHKVRVQNRKVDTAILTSASIYDSRMNELRMLLQTYDPGKGYIPGVADREIFYKMDLDPATYGDATVLSDTNIWGIEQVGRLWWDLRTVRYLDYEIYDTIDGGVDYRWKHWGRLAPGCNVDVYEWVRSPVPPSGYAEFLSKQKKSSDRPWYTGYVLDPDATQYVQRLEWNSKLSSDEVVYYFWVLNVSTVPNQMGRKLSAIQVANVIANPVANDIPYFAVIDHSKLILGGIKQFVADEDTVLKVKWKTSPDADTPHHKQWIILREQDERNTIDDRLWSKLRDSLVGWDTYALDDGTPAPKQVPDPALPLPQQIGNLVRPRQSWYPAVEWRDNDSRPSRDARGTFVETLNDILSRAAYTQIWFDWREIFEVGEQVPASSEYVATALDLAELNLMIQPTVNAVAVGERVLVENTRQASGHWTLWECIDLGGGERDFKLVDFQKWNMKEGLVWDRVDWFDSAWSPTDFPTYRFNDLQERDNSRPTDYQLLKGTLVQVDNQTPGDGIWAWYLLNEKGYTQVGRKAGTIKLNDIFHDNTKDRLGVKEIEELLGRDLTPADVSTVLAPAIANRDGSMELEWLMNSLRTRLLSTLQKNELFFSMVKSAFKANRTVDWAFKTSFLYLGGYSENLRQSPVAFKDQIDNVVAYLEEVKPYHVKIREYVRRLSYGPDIAKLAVTDFDKPVYIEKTGVGSLPPRKLDVTVASDEAILKTQNPWKFWFDNYLKTGYDPAEWNAGWNPIRRFRTRILLDRVSCSAIRGWDTAPWDPPLTLYSQKNPDIESLSALSWKYRNEYLWNHSLQQHYSDTTHLHVNNYVKDPVTNLVSPNRFGDCAVSTMAERDQIPSYSRVQGTIVVVRADESRWMWTGQKWAPFESIGWDQDVSYGAAGRIDRFYQPLPGMEPRGTPGLIEGCDFSGTVISSSFRDGAWDMFEWDNAGWGSEYTDHVGFDPDTIVDEPQGDNDAAIDIVGNGFAQPGVSGRNAAEQMFFTGKDFLNITVKKKIAGIEGPLMRATKNQIDGWDLQDLEDAAVTVVAWDQTAKTLTLDTSDGVFPFHDPNNPSQEYMDKVKLMTGFYSTSSVDMTLEEKTFELRDADGSIVDRIPAGLSGNGVRVVLENADNAEERMIGTVSVNSHGNENMLWEGNLVVNVTGYVGDEPADIVTERAKWNIIPLELYAPKGQIWVGQAKISYSSVAAGDDNQFILSDAKVDGGSLAGVVAVQDADEKVIYWRQLPADKLGVSIVGKIGLPTATPEGEPIRIYDASLMHRIMK